MQLSQDAQLANNLSSIPVSICSFRVPAFCAVTLHGGDNTPVCRGSTAHRVVRVGALEPEMIIYPFAATMQ